MRCDENILNFEEFSLEFGERQIDVFTLKSTAISPNAG
jgi:hypothetical protein